MVELHYQKNLEKEMRKIDLNNCSESDLDKIVDGCVSLERKRNTKISFAMSAIASGIAYGILCKESPPLAVLLGLYAGMRVSSLMIGDFNEDKELEVEYYNILKNK